MPLTAAPCRAAALLPAQELSTLVYALARVHCYAPGALEAASARATRQLAAAAPQDASMLLWGFAKLGFHPGKGLLDALPRAVVKRLPDFKPQVGRGAGRGGPTARLAGERGGRALAEGLPLSPCSSHGAIAAGCIVFTAAQAPLGPAPQRPARAAP